MKNSIVPADISSQGIPAIGGASNAPVPYDAGWDTPPAEPTGVDNGARFRRYWAAIKRFWWLVAGLMAIGTVGGIVATRYVDPVYYAQGSMLIADLTSPGSATGGAFRNPNLLPNGAWIDLFKTYTVIEEVVARQKLWYKAKTWEDSVALDSIRPTFRVGVGDYTYHLDTLGNYTLRDALVKEKDGLIERGRFGDTVGRAAGFIWLPSEAGLKGRRTVRFTDV